jgi:hypothetical protein
MAISQCLFKHVGNSDIFPVQLFIYLRALNLSVIYRLDKFLGVTCFQKLLNSTRVCRKGTQ